MRASHPGHIAPYWVWRNDHPVDRPGPTPYGYEILKIESEKLVLKPDPKNLLISECLVNGAQPKFVE